MLAVPLGSIASSLVACPRWLFKIFSAVQCTSAILVGICALGLIPAMAPFWQSKGGCSERSGKIFTFDPQVTPNDIRS